MGCCGVWWKLSLSCAIRSRRFWADEAIDRGASLRHKRRMTALLYRAVLGLVIQQEALLCFASPASRALSREMRLGQSGLESRHSRTSLEWLRKRSGTSGRYQWAVQRDGCLSPPSWLLVNECR